MALDEKIQEFINFRKKVCSIMLQEDQSRMGKLYVQAQDNLLKELEDLLKDFTLQSRTAADGKVVE